MKNLDRHPILRIIGYVMLGIEILLCLSVPIAAVLNLTSMKEIITNVLYVCIFANVVLAFVIKLVTK